MAQDPRFNSDNILSQIGNFANLDWIDQLLYRFVIIPQTKERLLAGDPHFLWAYSGGTSVWGRGSDGRCIQASICPTARARTGISPTCATERLLSQPVTRRNWA
jgi:hypothetical protein